MHKTIVFKQNKANQQEKEKHQWTRMNKANTLEGNTWTGFKAFLWPIVFPHATSSVQVL